MLEQSLKLHGRLSLELRKANGEVQVVEKDNIIVNVGFDFIANAIGAASGRPGVMNHIGVGTSATAAAAGQTDLQAPLMRKPAAYAHTADTKVFTFTTTFNAGEATGAITEAGVFNALAAGIMLDRVTFSVINKGADDTLTATFTFTMS